MLVDDEVEKLCVCELEEGCLAVIKIVKEKNKSRQILKR